ncbi:MAG: hypothetical protein IT536_11705 [Hyphomicrobiales bacterium]|nr:hypothetical protein [Hyphomicrobiales bacterium]
MRLPWKILIGIAGLVTGYFAWVSRPEPGDRAELTDTCSFSTIDNAQYRGLVAEAKKLIEPNRRRIANGDGNIEQGAVNPPLRDLAQEFVKRSRSTEEAFVRLFAFGRALDGRVENAAPVQETFPGPWARWTNRDERDNKLARPRLLMRAGFQGPPGLFQYPIGTWFGARLFGRRYERFAIGVTFDVPDKVSLENALIGSHIVSAGAGKALLIYPLNSIHWGDVRIESRCPDAERFLNHVGRLLKQKKN